MAERHYVGEIGTVITVDCNVDISGAVAQELRVRKEDGTEETWTASVFGTQYLRHTTVAADFSVAGEYALNAYVEDSDGWKGLGETDTFRIYDSFRPR